MRGSARAAAAGCEIEHAWAELEVPAEEPNLLRAGRVLQLMPTFDDGVPPRHAPHLMPVPAPSSQKKSGYNWTCRPGDRGPARAGPRKVRTPQGRTLGKSQTAKADGKWHRKETARGEKNSPETPRVRVKGWGKSPPASW